MRPGDTARLVCPITGAFRGLVRIVNYSDGICTVWNETPILDWITTGENGEYPYRVAYEIGHRFNAESSELFPTGGPEAR